MLRREEWRRRQAARVLQAPLLRDSMTATDSNSDTRERERGIFRGRNRI